MSYAVLCVVGSIPDTLLNLVNLENVEITATKLEGGFGRIISHREPPYFTRNRRFYFPAQENNDHVTMRTHFRFSTLLIPLLVLLYASLLAVNAWLWLNDPNVGHVFEEVKKLRKRIEGTADCYVLTSP